MKNISTNYPYTIAIAIRITGSDTDIYLTHTAIGWQVEVQEPNHNHEAFAHVAALPRNQDLILVV